MKADATYGSDHAGLVCAYAFTPGGAGRAIESGAAAALLTSTVVLFVTAIVAGGAMLATRLRNRS